VERLSFGLKLGEEPVFFGLVDGYDGLSTRF
jgi:hypothetical protein